MLFTVAAGFLLYFNTFNAPFLFDDYPNIVNNLRIRNISNLLPPTGSRDIGYITFALNYKFSLLNVSAYHFVNTLIHICNAILVYVLYMLLLKNFSPEGSDNKNQFIAACTALVFLTHPIQTSAVTYIVQRFTSLSTLFFLLSVFMYIKASLNYSRNRRFLSESHLSYYLLSILSAVLAMKTKEITVTLPLIILMSEFFLYSATDRNNYRAKPLMYFVPFVLTFFIIPVGLINTDAPIGEIIGEISDKSTETENIGRPEYLFTQFRVIATYLRLMFIPAGQNLDYDYRISTSFFEPSVLLSLSLNILIIASAILIFSRVKKGAAIIIAFGIFWFYITLSVESSIIPIKDVIFEHRLYLPSSGLITAAITGLVISTEKFPKEKSRKVIIFSFILVLLILSVLTIRRNMLWQDGIAIWEDTIKKSPFKSRPHSNLANIYQEKGMHSEAEKEYLKAIGLSPTFPGLYNNLGNVYKAQGKYYDALNEYTKAIDLDSKFAEGYYNLGATLYELGEKEEALSNLYKAIEISPEMFDAFTTIGNIYDDLGRKVEALQAYAKSLEINPYSHMAYYNRGVLYEGIGDIENAKKDYMRAIELNPKWDLPRKRLREITN